MQIKYPLAATSWGQEEIEAMYEVIESGFFTMGTKVSQYEKQFANYFGSKYAVMVNSGSSANLLAIAALFFRKSGLNLRRGDEVIVPAVSWATTYTPLQQYGLKVKFVDVDAGTLNFNLQELKKAITDKTKLIFAVNLLGNSNDYKDINSLIEGKDILLIEDNCESMGATFDGQYTGTFGLMGTFSSFFSHHISTMEGGTILTDDEELYHILLSLRSHGWTRHLPASNWVTGQKSQDAFEESFKFVLPGYNLRPLELSGAIGCEQLDKLPTLLDERRKNASLFLEKMSSINYLTYQQEIGESSWFGFSLILDPEYNKNRKQLIDFLNNAGIETRPIVAGNFLKNEVVKFFDYEIVGDLKNAELIDQQGFFIGNHHFNLNQEISYLIEQLQKFQNE